MSKHWLSHAGRTAGLDSPRRAARGAGAAEPSRKVAPRRAHRHSMIVVHDALIQPGCVGDHRRPVLTEAGVMTGYHTRWVLQAAEADDPERACGACVRTSSISCRLDGFTSARPATTTVGTVSFPAATDRTNALARGSFRMLTFR
jgi:hypothetical protein